MSPGPTWLSHVAGLFTASQSTTSIFPPRRRWNATMKLPLLSPNTKSSTTTTDHGVGFAHLEGCCCGQQTDADKTDGQQTTTSISQLHRYHRMQPWIQACTPTAPVCSCVSILRPSQSTPPSTAAFHSIQRLLQSTAVHDW